MRRAAATYLSSCKDSEADWCDLNRTVKCVWEFTVPTPLNSESGSCDGQGPDSMPSSWAAITAQTVGNPLFLAGFVSSLWVLSPNSGPPPRRRVCVPSTQLPDPSWGGADLSPVLVCLLGVSGVSFESPGARGGRDPYSFVGTLVHPCVVPPFLTPTPPSLVARRREPLTIPTLVLLWDRFGIRPVYIGGGFETLMT